MALVFALAGATLMYTGCTKDYDEDINALEQKVNALESDLSQKVSDLQGQVANLKSSISALEAADAALQKSVDANKADIKTLQDKVAAIEKAIADLNKYATKDELKAATDALDEKIAEAKKSILDEAKKLQDQIDALKADLEKKADKAEVEEKLKALEEAQKEIDNVYGFLSDELRAIVFFPDFYFGGIEATSYDFASLWGLEPKASGAAVTAVDDNKASVTFPKGQKITAEEVISKNAKGIIYYAVDPDSYEYVLGEDGKPVVYKDGMKNARGVAMLKYPWWPTNRSVGQVGIARYDLNPSSFPIDSAEWSLNGMNRRYVVKSDDALFWQPVFEGISKNGQQVEVKYSIANPEVLFSSIISAFPASYIRVADLEAAEQSNKEKEAERMAEVRAYYRYLTAAYETGSYNNVPVMQLVGALDEDRDVRSDWHAISSSEEMVDHLAFINGNGNKTTQVYPNTNCNLGKNQFGSLTIKDLYATAKLAAENVASLPVKYNEGPVDLAKEIAIHTTDPYTSQPMSVYTLEQFVKKYPGFSYKFELIQYTVGDNKTSEDKYGVINGTEFTPCYVEPDGKQVVIAKDSEEKQGISSVGRKPIVLAYLVDEAGNSYAVGYFKIEIVKEKRVADETIINLPDRGTVPFICGPFELKTTWSEYSYYVLETLKVDYDDFAKEYTFDGVYSYEIANVYGMLMPALVKIGEGTKTSPALKYNEPQADGSTKALDFGTAYYEVDKTGSTVNDKFVWNVSSKDIGQGNTKSIYFKFKKSEYEIVYFVMDANVADAAKFNFGEKLENEWYDDINAEPYNTGRINVLVPNKTDDDVTNFYRDLNTFLRGKKPQLVLADDSDPVYKKFYTNPATSGYKKAEMDSKVVYYFSEEQPVIKGINKLTDFWYDADGKSMVTDLPLYTNYWEDNTKLFVPEYTKKSGKYVVKTVDLVIDGETVLDENDDPVQRPELLDKNLIATLTPEGVITYNYAEGQTAAKVLLNLWSYLETDQSKMLYANVLVDMFYGACKIPAGQDGFHMRFVRPIDIQFADVDVASESKVTGYNLLVAKFISGITDWNKMKVIVPAPQRDEDNKPVKDEDGNIIYTEYFEPNVLNEVDMYAYYGFKKLTIDIENAERDHVKIGDPDFRGSFFEETPDATLKVGTVEFGEDDYGRPTEKFTEGSTTIDISELENLMGACIHYENGRAVVEMFHVFIPVTVEYAWGTITGELMITVNKTKDTPGE